VSERARPGSNRLWPCSCPSEAFSPQGFPMTATADRQMELTLPMVPDIEIAAARATGNLARELGMSSEKVDEMTHAVIEACINAREHSGCADNRIYLRFVGTSLAGGSPRIDIWITDHGRGFDQSEAKLRRK